MMQSAILRWTGRVTRMSNDRIPKRLLYSRLATGKGTKGNHATYANQVKHILRACGIPPVDLEVLAAGRANWRNVYKAGVARAEHARIECLKDKRQRRKQRAGLDLPQPPPKHQHTLIKFPPFNNLKNTAFFFGFSTPQQCRNARLTSKALRHFGAGLPAASPGLPILAAAS